MLDSSQLARKMANVAQTRARRITCSVASKSHPSWLEFRGNGSLPECQVRGTNEAAAAADSAASCVTLWANAEPD